MKSSRDNFIISLSESILKVGFGELIERSLKTYTGAIIAEITSETGKAFLANYTGPLLNVILKVSDENQKNIKKIIGEPIITGIREANEAFNITERSNKDIGEVNAKFQLADEKLSVAITFERFDNNPTKVAFIYFIRGLIAHKKGAIDTAKSYFDEVLKELDDLKYEYDRKICKLDHRNIIKHMPRGHGDLRRIEKRANELESVARLYEFAESYSKTSNIDYSKALERNSEPLRSQNPSV
ncbi:MAG: hypothetical protein MI748_09080 [Opitutales bacterium]|nr:hypothetical protein [Opitutales bacterium]